MEERRGLETGGATESWTVELGAGRLGPRLAFRLPRESGYARLGSRRSQQCPLVMLACCQHERELCVVCFVAEEDFHPYQRLH